MARPDPPKHGLCHVLHLQVKGHHGDLLKALCSHPYGPLLAPARLRNRAGHSTELFCP